ncbi:hypothetical protein ERJ75_001336600 [Trypanosoma vivax]|nr:hypothetical protein TRVL_06863 [Trypanosoma vivax]KAH8607802.1 hypothetical protein ERJ75_001336600 [Trypanosoma vivax]
MSYFSKLSNYRSLGLFLTVGAVSAPVLYNVFGTPSAHRDTTSFDVLDVMEVEEHARYPCVALKGHDVVVWNHYALSARQRNSSSEGRLHGVFSTLGCARTLGGFLALFSNEKHTLVGQCDSAAEENQLHLVREVVGNAREPSQTPTSVPTASSISEEADQSLGLTEPLVASSTWPAGRSKYASLTIEPSLDTSLARHGTSLHRWADRATHQSFVRCDPFGPSFVNCYGDASYLGAPYLRVMLSAFLLLPQPLPRLRVAVFGVGGGSLPSFLQRYFSRNISRLDLVDIEPQCFRAAVEDLGMRHEMGGGSVVCHARDAVSFLEELADVPSDTMAADGLGALLEPPKATVPPSMGIKAESPNRKNRPKRYDIIFVDLFVGSEMAPFVSSASFVHLCRGALSSIGVAAFNLPAPDPAFIESCCQVFDKQNVYCFPVPKSSNVIVLARRTPTNSHVARRHFYRGALQLQKFHRLPYDLAGHYPLWWRLW